MNKWIAEFELEDGDKMPEHMDLTYKGIKLDFHCRPITECEDVISRQEVIETLKELDWRYNGHPGGEVYGAIYKLPPVQPKILACGEGELDVPDTNAGDTISRQAVIDTIFTECSSTKLDIDFAKVLILRRAIKALPPVQSQETGRWIENENGHLFCSKCGFTLDDEGHYSNEVQALENKFCKNCGTKMRWTGGHLGDWIPVSEKLPKYGKEVLTCSNGGFIEIQSLEDGGYWENQKGDWTDFDEVIAWSPLPEPYKPQESEE